VLLTGLSWGVALGAQGGSEQELRELREAIEESRERVAEFEREQRGLLEVLERIDRTTAALARDRAHARREAATARQALAEYTAQAAAIEPRLERTQRDLIRRAVALYKTGEVGPVQLLFAADDLPELFSRIDVLQRLLTHDQHLLARYRRQQTALDAARRQAAKAATRHERAQLRMRARARELEAEWATKRELLVRARDSRSQERAMLAELEVAARALEETLLRLHDSPAPWPGPRSGPSFESLRGWLPGPLDAPIVRPFGRTVDAEFRTQVFRKGVDFEAPRGTEVHAVAPGSVRLADWFRGYGRVVILDHGERYFTVCGHLDEIRVRLGEEVDQGDAIGTVGDTGSLAGPKLYFELRRGGEALDPGEWLAPGGPS
jgi:septal ring factor EnvC (AmiA/AmiB activator)